ncbi:MAG: sulfite exporter TauE/SafE family protein [Chloroflexota bacterium]
MTDTSLPSASAAKTPATATDQSGLQAWADKLGVSKRTLFAGIALPMISFVAIAATLTVAPADERQLILLSALVSVAAGIAVSSVGVYGGVLVPGLLLLGVDARFVAALSLGLQVLVVPLAAGSHYQMGNFSRSVALPLVIGGVIGAFVGPLFAAILPKDLIVRVIAALIIIVGVIALATLRLRGLGQPRSADDIPQARVGGIGLLAGFSSGISGAGWGPIGMTLLILSRIDPRQAVGSSLVARIFMAAAAVVGFIIAQNAVNTVTPNWWIVVPLLAGSIAPMIGGAVLLSRLGRARATVAITLLSIALALPSLLFGH